MTISTAFGWWLIPASVTIAYLVWVATRRRSPSGGDYNFAPLFDGLFDLILIIPVLLVWLLWSLLR